MSGSPRLLATAIALLLPAAAVGAPASAPSAGKATVLKSLSVLKQADLDFGELVVSGAGTAVIDPVSGATTTTGLVMPVGPAGHPATFTATGSRNSVVIIRVPNSPVTLTRVGGGGTMTVSNWTLDGPVNRRIPLNSAFNFSVGGRLNVGAAQAEGTYTGTFAITVQYP
jgi:spore coat protein U-like protein